MAFEGKSVTMNDMNDFRARTVSEGCFNNFRARSMSEGYSLAYVAGSEIVVV